MNPSKHFTFFFFLAALAALLVSGSARAATIQLLGSYIPHGIDGNNVVGSTGSNQGFIYNGHMTTLIPNSSSANGIAGNLVVGNWGNQGFEYDLATKAYSTLVDPLGAKGTFPLGTDGSSIVGYYRDASSIAHGFLYSIAAQSWTTLDDPLETQGTFLFGISGNNIVGEYDSAGVGHGFLFNGATWSTLPATAADAAGIAGNQIVGITVGGGVQGFGIGYTFDIDTGQFSFPLSFGDFPVGTTEFQFEGISGDKVVGTYSVIRLGTFGFVATIPEPTSLTLALAAAACFIAWFRCRASPTSRAGL